MLKTHTVLKSGDDKTGPLAGTYRTHESCPDTCAFLPRKYDGPGGCFGTGRIGHIAEQYGVCDSDYRKVRALAVDMPAGHTFRPNIVGDFNQGDGTPDWSYIRACNYVAETRTDCTVFAYTHLWRKIDRNAFGFPVRASCETIQDVLDARERGYSAVIVDNGTLDFATADAETGAHFMTCRHTTHGTQCVDCGACCRDSNLVIVFPVHSASAKLASAAIDKARASATI